MTTVASLRFRSDEENQEHARRSDQVRLGTTAHVARSAHAEVA